jgi:hypothetical protein
MEMPRPTVPSAYVVLQGQDGQDKEVLGAASSLEGAKVIGEQFGTRKPLGWDQTTPCYWWGTGTDIFIVQTQWWG